MEILLPEREQHILEAIVRDYIAHAVPVSSQRIHERGGVGASPATIRNIMCDLTDRGYVMQPHTSAGRIPTQRGYRFFVDHCRETRVLPPRIEAQLRALSNWRQVLHLITHETHLLAAAASLKAHTAYTFGAHTLLAAPEFRDPELVIQFGSFVDVFSDRLAAYIPYLEGPTPHIFIEEENPVAEARWGSVVATQTASHIIFAIGPARMDYEGAGAVLESLALVTGIDDVFYG